MCCSLTRYFWREYFIGGLVPVLHCVAFSKCWLLRHAANKQISCKLGDKVGDDKNLAVVFNYDGKVRG